MSGLPTESFLSTVLGAEDVLIFVDGGARSGAYIIPDLQPWSCIYCFEPNPDEVAKIGRLGDAQAALPPARTAIRVFPTALCTATGTATLNISLRPGATSTLQPDAALLSRFAPDNFSEMAEIVRRVEVPAISLADFVSQTRLEHIDFLKLDTQGNELDILQSAAGFLDQVSVIKTEVEFLPLYRDQKLFHDVMGFLNSRGFELIDICWTAPCRRFHAVDDLPATAYRLVWGDAIFARSPHGPPHRRRLQQALILGGLGYADLAIDMTRRYGNLAAGTQQELERQFRAWVSPRSLRGRLKRVVERWLGISLTRFDWRRGQQVASAAANRPRP